MPLSRVETGKLVERLTKALPEVEARLHPDVVRIRFSFGEDWSGDEAIFFRVVLSDRAKEVASLGEFTSRIRSQIADGLQLEDLDQFAYFRYRTESEQRQLRSPEWD